MAIVRRSANRVRIAVSVMEDAELAASYAGFLSVDGVFIMCTHPPCIPQVQYLTKPLARSVIWVDVLR